MKYVAMVFFLMVAVGGNSPLYAAEPTRAADGSKPIVHPPYLHQFKYNGGPPAVVDVVIDLKDLLCSNEHCFDFQLLNGSESEITVDRVEITCGCLVAKPSSRTARPGKEISLTITLKPGSQEGHYSKLLHVYVKVGSDERLVHLQLECNGDVRKPISFSQQRITLRRSKAQLDSSGILTWQFDAKRFAPLNMADIEFATDVSKLHVSVVGRDMDVVHCVFAGNANELKHGDVFRVRAFDRSQAGPRSTELLALPIVYLDEGAVRTLPDVVVGQEQEAGKRLAIFKLILPAKVSYIDKSISMGVSEAVAGRSVLLQVSRVQERIMEVQADISSLPSGSHAFSGEMRVTNAGDGEESNLHFSGTLIVPDHG